MAAAAYHTSLVKAIQSLDSLNDQIVQYIFTPKDVTLDLDRELSSHEQETLRSSMLLIRRLLMDAQGKFRKMVEDNKQLAARIDGSIHAANQEVNALRAELADTNKRLTQISSGSSKPNDNLLPLAFQGNDCVPSNLVFGALYYRELGSSELVNNDQYSGKQNQVVPVSNFTNELAHLNEQNMQLELQVSNLSRELEELRKTKTTSRIQQTGYGELKLELIQTKRELNRAKEALQALKADRKRLKAEKLELLNQMKQLYGALEEKETELREFIRKYEQRMAENDESIKKLASEKEDVEREKWEIIKRAREAAERSVMLQSKLDSKEKLVQKMQSDLSELRNQFASICRTRASVTSDVFEKSTCMDESQSADELPSYETPPVSAKSTEDKSFKSMTNSSPASMTEGDTGSGSPLMSLLSSSQEILDNEVKRQKKKKSLGSLTKMFSKPRSRRSMALASESELEDSNSSTPRVSLLSPENHQEKLQLVEQLKGVHMSQWKANQVLAWLEVYLCMPGYGQMCCDNIKSGKVLLGLSDSELSSALGITNPMHRRKLRLAIEDQRDLSEIKYPKASELDQNWVCQRWLNDIGLPQYKGTFETQLVDGRMLNTISKKDMEKHFAIHRKFHQASILHAVELLKAVDFDKEALSERRAKCEDQNIDPLVWSTQRVIKWVKTIDLKEYADNLKESGVHGALIVLEPLFNADTLATALGIPPSKSYVRRHLITELDALIKPARALLDTTVHYKKKANGGSLGRSFPRSFRTNTSVDDLTPKSRMSIRGSIGKAFGRKNRGGFDSKDSSDADTPTHTKQNISEPIAMRHRSCDLDFSSTTV